MKVSKELNRAACRNPRLKHLVEKELHVNIRCGPIVIEEPEEEPEPIPMEFLITNPSVNLRNDFIGRVGFQFILFTPIIITHLGRWIVDGNSGDHTVRVTYNVNFTFGSVVISTAGKSAGGFWYEKLAVPLLVEAGTYHLFSGEFSGGDLWYSNTAAAAIDPAIGLVNVSAYSNDGEGNEIFFQNGSATFVPVNFKYILP